VKATSSRRHRTRQALAQRRELLRLRGVVHVGKRRAHRPAVLVEQAPRQHHPRRWCSSARRHQRLHDERVRLTLVPLIVWNFVCPAPARWARRAPRPCRGPRRGRARRCGWRLRRRPRTRAVRVAVVVEVRLALEHRGEVALAGSSGVRSQKSGESGVTSSRYATSYRGLIVVARPADDVLQVERLVEADGDGLVGAQPSSLSSSSRVADSHFVAASIEALMRRFVGAVASKRVAKSLGSGASGSGRAKGSNFTAAPEPRMGMRPLPSGRRTSRGRRGRRGAGASAWRGSSSDADHQAKPAEAHRPHRGDLPGRVGRQVHLPGSQAPLRWR
jgi:hypothetical protein